MEAILFAFPTTYDLPTTTCFVTSYTPDTPFSFGTTQKKRRDECPAALVVDWVMGRYTQSPALRRCLSGKDDER